MELNDWLLALHLLAAASLVAAVVLFNVLIVASWNLDVPSSVVRVMGVARWGNILVTIGSVGVLVLGVLLAFTKDSYAIWDPWIIAAIVLWAIFAATGMRSGKLYTVAGVHAESLVASGNDAPNPGLSAMLRSPRALWLNIASNVAVVLLILDMIFKPGA
jgi:phosphoglycerol transferase MdoB-like AlkP superfamily enzyme